MEKKKKKEAFLEDEYKPKTLKKNESKYEMQPRSTIDEKQEIKESHHLTPDHHEEIDFNEHPIFISLESNHLKDKSCEMKMLMEEDSLSYFKHKSSEHQLGKIKEENSDD